MPQYTWDNNKKTLVPKKRNKKAVDHSDGDNQPDTATNSTTTTKEKKTKTSSTEIPSIS